MVLLQRAHIRLLNLRVRQEFLAFACHRHPPCFENESTMGNFQGLMNILLDQQNRNLLLIESLDEFEDQLHNKRSQSERRFIQHEKFWSRHQGPSNGNHLLLSPAHPPSQLALSFF